MGFERLLGNQRLKDNLISSLARGRVSHFYLISGPTGSGKHTLARLLSAAIQCQQENAPCLSCSACRKVMADSHPDVITVVDPEHKNVAVRIVRDARADMYVMPNEGHRKIYLFPQEMGIEGQNALLKILEEPPQYGVFILLTDNPEKLLPTVRSRCTQLSLSALPRDVLEDALARQFPDGDAAARQAAAERSGGFLGQALSLMEQGNSLSAQTQSFVSGFSRRDVMALLQTLVPMEKWKRDQAIAEWENWLDILHQALLCRSGSGVISPQAREIGTNRSSQEIMQAIRSLQKGVEYAQGNVSVAAICGHLEWALR